MRKYGEVMKMKVRKFSLSKKFFFAIVIQIIICNVILALSVRAKGMDVVRNEIRNTAMNYAILAANRIDGDKFDDIGEGDEESAQFEEIKSIFQDFLVVEDIQFVYSFRVDDEENVTFVVDADSEDPAVIGEEYDSLEGILLAQNGQANADEEISEDEWGSYYSAYAPIMTGDRVVGVVGVDIDSSLAGKKISGLVHIIIFMCLLVCVLALVALSILSKELTKGFVILNTKIRELSDGSGDLNRRIDINSGDELEVLAESINGLLAEMGQLVGKIANMTDINANTIREMNSQVMELSANMEECSATSEAISNSLSNTSDEVMLLSKEVSQVEELVNKEYLLAKESKETATKNRDYAVSKIQSIKKQIDAATESAKSVEQVDEVTDKIKSIALQTRILSLNAQVEAARAGEHGQGFAVVATEVERLSEQIHGAVDEIGVINEQVIAAMKEIVKNMNDIVAFIDKDVFEDYTEYAKLGEAYGTATSSISETMSALKNKSEYITRVVNDADRSIRDISNAVSDSAGQIEKVNMASSEIAEGMSELLKNQLIRNMK